MQRKWIVFILRYFDFWGCCTEFAATKRYDECYLLIFLLHIVLMLVTSWFIVAFVKHPTDDTLGHLNDTFKLIIQRTFHTKRTFQSNSYAVKLLLYTSASIIATSFFYPYLDVFLMPQNDDKVSYIWFAYDLVTKVYQNRMWCYLFYLDLIRCEWNKIKQIVERATQIKLIETYQINNRRSRVPLKCKRSLKQICEYYQLIRELSECLNAAFSWSNAVAILSTFGFILTELNWIYWKWYNDDKFTNMLDYVIWIVRLTFTILLVFHTAIGCKHQVTQLEQYFLEI